MNSKQLLKTGIALAALCSSPFAFANRENWTSDFSAAKKEAAESKKDLLMDFTGSDWCSWCIKLDKEVFSLDPFKAGVKDKFVLVELDYPKDKTILTEATIKQNAELVKTYAIKGYPTILLCDSEGRPYASTGYQPGGPESYVAQLNELRAKKATRDEAFAAAAKLSGVEKAKSLVGALKAMELDDAVAANCYPTVIEEIKASDPKDETGFAKAAAAKQKVADFSNKLNELGSKKDFDGALALVDSTIKEGGMEKEETQQLMMTRVMIFVQQKKFDEAITAANAAKAFNPDGKVAGSIENFVKQIEMMKEKSAPSTEETKG